MPWTDHHPCHPQSSCHSENCTHPREDLLHKQSGNQFPGTGLTADRAFVMNEGCETRTLFWDGTPGSDGRIHLYFPSKYSFHSAWFSGPRFVVKLAHMCGKCWQLIRVILKSIFDIKWLPFEFPKAISERSENFTQLQVIVRTAPSNSKQLSRQHCGSVGLFQVAQW